MRRPSFRDEAGLAGKILVGVIAWALGAVLLLTNTLVAAQQIEVVGRVAELEPLHRVLLVRPAAQVAAREHGVFGAGGRRRFSFRFRDFSFCHDLLTLSASLKFIQYFSHWEAFLLS